MLTHFRKIAQLIYKTGCSYEKFRLRYRATMDWSPARELHFSKFLKNTHFCIGHHISKKWHVHAAIRGCFFHFQKT